jgi:hypothetical protein
MMERLIDPDPALRETALEELQSLNDVGDQPLIIYLLTTRLMDPVLEIRFRVVQSVGGLLSGDSHQGSLSDHSLQVLTAFTTQIDKHQLVKLLEVSAAYLAAEEAIMGILRLCSYAGKVLGGIVNDRKLPVEIRQHAIFYSGEVGFLSATGAIRNLVQRNRKSKARPEWIPIRKKHLDEEILLPFAEAALGKLEGS